MHLQGATISIATYKRPDLLRSLLTACVSQISDDHRRVRVVVVDNDPLGSAGGVASQFPSVEYLVEPTPGIAAARNKGLDALDVGEEAIIFIDDDELPTPGWLTSLLDYADSAGADIVTGPVEPSIDESVPSWIIRGGFWQRQRRATGTTPDSVATNNTLLRLSAWRGTGIRFSEELSMKGGSDTEFFRALRAHASLTAVWAGHAVVKEHVLPERANAKWLFRRAVRIGNINARYRSRAAALIGGLARVTVGAPFVVVDYVLHRHPVARSWNMLAHGVGMIGNVMDADVVEYRRPRS